MRSDWSFLQIEADSVAFLAYDLAFSDDAFQLMSELNRLAGSDEIDVRVTDPGPAYFERQGLAPRRVFKSFSTEYRTWVLGGTADINADAPLYRADAVIWQGANWLCKGLRGVNLCVLAIFDQECANAQRSWINSDRWNGIIRSVADLDCVELEFLQRAEFAAFMERMTAWYGNS